MARVKRLCNIKAARLRYLAADYVTVSTCYVRCVNRKQAARDARHNISNQKMVRSNILTLTTPNYFSINPFKIIINILLSFFRFIWIPVLWVCGHCKYFYSYSVGIDMRRQNLTSKVDPRAIRGRFLKTLWWYTIYYNAMKIPFYILCQN